MIEDKLTHDERLRLEAVAQSIQRRSTSVDIDQVLADARVIAAFVRDGSAA